MYDCFVRPSLSVPQIAGGAFSIRVHEKAVLVISYIGFLDKEVTASGNNLTIGLTKGDKSMDDVVVIGYGTQKRAIR
jgi:hypothetical protein